MACAYRPGKKGVLLTTNSTLCVYDLCDVKNRDGGRLLHACDTCSVLALVGVLEGVMLCHTGMTSWLHV